jgi:hypothetical protein
MKALTPLVYKELRQLAASYLRKERQGHTLQPTALVHEAHRFSGHIQRLRCLLRRIYRTARRIPVLGFATSLVNDIPATCPRWFKKTGKSHVLFSGEQFLNFAAQNPETVEVAGHPWGAGFKPVTMYACAPRSMTERRSTDEIMETRVSYDD